MARILNLLIVILEIISLSKSFKRNGFIKNLVFYTQISNFLTFISSGLLVIFGPVEWVELLRYLSVSMLIMTFFVTAFILVPMSHRAKELLFSGSGLYHHLIIPILSTLSYLFTENRVSMFWAWLPGVVTLSYGLIMLYLNYIDRVKGPYPFFWVKENGIKATVLWMVALLAAISMFSALAGARL